MPKHRHSLGGKYTSEVNVPIPEPQFTAAEVKALKLLAIAGGTGGTTPIPNPPPPPPPPDVTAPTISGVTITAITTSGGTINATTSEASTVVVRHSLESNLAGFATTAATASGTSHNRTLTGYAANVRVYFQVVATDTAGNVRVDSIRSFQTQAVVIPPGPEPPGSSVTVNTFAELRAAVDNLSISTVIVEDGTYNIGYFLPPIARPSSNPLLVQADNIPADPADPHGVIFTGNMYFRNRRGSYTTWQGISFENTSVSDTGIVVFGAYGEPGPDHVTFLDTRFVNNTPLNGHQSQHWYSADGNPSDILIDRFYVEGINHSSFSGWHGYHNPMGARHTVRNGVIKNVYAGLIGYGDMTDLLFENILIDGVRFSTDIIGLETTLINVDAINVDMGGTLKQSGSGGVGPITIGAGCSGLPAVTP
jgi:hypothetical protein